VKQNKVACFENRLKTNSTVLWNVNIMQFGRQASQFWKKPAASILRGEVKPGYLQSESQLCDCRHWKCRRSER